MAVFVGEIVLVICCVVGFIQIVGWLLDTHPSQQNNNTKD